MHNLHLVRIKAKSHDDACSSVLSLMEGWGDENNWRSAGGAICEDGTSEPYEDYSRWGVDTDVQEQIKRLNDMCFRELQGKEYTEGAYSDRLKSVLKDKTTQEMLDYDEWMDFYIAKQFFNFLLYTAEARKECKDSYDIFTSEEFYSYSYGDFGLTDFGSNGHTEEELKECKTYIVLIDMHT